MSDTMKTAMHAVLEDMGRAAREGKARRFTKTKPGHAAREGITMGEVTLEPHEGQADVEVDPVKEQNITDDEMDQLLTVER